MGIYYTVAYPDTTILPVRLSAAALVLDLTLVIKLQQSVIAAVFGRQWSRVESFRRLLCNYNQERRSFTRLNSRNGCR